MMIMKKYRLYEALVDYYNQYLPNECGVSQKTIENYTYAFQLFFTYMRDVKGINLEKLSLMDINKSNIIDFLDWTEKVRGCSVATRNNRLATFGSFAKFLQYRDIMNMAQWHQILSIKKKKCKGREMNYIKYPGMKLILSLPDSNTMVGLRDLAFLSLMYDSAARVSEMIHLTPSCVHFDDITTVKIFGKGSKIRFVPLDKDDVTILRRYMETNGLLQPEKNQRPLFPNRQGFCMSRMAAWNIVQKYVTTATEMNPELIPHNVGCHTFRHSKAMHMLEAGVQLHVIRDFLGHTSVVTTEIYARASEKMKQEALSKVNQNVLPKGKTSWQKKKGLLALLLSYREKNEQ